MVGRRILQSAANLHYSSVVLNFAIPGGKKERKKERIQFEIN